MRASAEIAALAAALWLTACGGDQTGVVVFEGQLAPELKLVGSALVEANRNSIFCKDFLLQSPQPVGESINAKFERLPKDRYRLTFDLREAKWGGFCDLALRVIDVGAEPNRVYHGGNRSVFSVVPKDAFKHGWYRKEIPLEPVMTTHCSPAPDDYLDCVELRRTAPDLNGDHHFVLNVLYQPKPQVAEPTP